MAYNVAIDGPAGAGKSTVAKQLADELKMTYIDTGAMYRAITLLAIEEGETDTNKITELAKKAHIDIKGNRILLNNVDVTEKIRSFKVTEAVSKISQIPEIRHIMVKLQKEIAYNKGIVMDGRDIGTKVIPDAKYKFYLTADLKERARRRYEELISKGLQTTYKQVEEDILKRDQQDKNRSCSPLVIAPDAIVVDSTSKNIQEVVEELLDIIRRGEKLVL